MKVLLTNVPKYNWSGNEMNIDYIYVKLIIEFVNNVPKHYKVGKAF